MPRLDLYGPSYAGQPASPLFVLPSSTEEREAWSGRMAALPRLADDRRAAFLADYRSAMDGIDAANAASDGYWYSALGSRNTQTSRFYQGLEQLWRLDQALASGEGLSLVVPDRAMLPLVRALARARGVEARFHGGYPRRRWLDPLRRPWGALRYMLALCDFGRGQGDHGPADNEIIVVTVSMTSLLQPDRRVRDLLFGDLPADLATAGRRVLMLAQITGDPRPGPVPARTLPPPPVRTLADLARSRDAMAAVLRAAAWRPRLGPARSRLGIDLAPLLRLDAAASRWRDLPAAEMLRAALARLLRRSPRAVLLHPFENNGWEHACQAAARAGRNRTVAVQHNAPLPSAEKTYASRHRPHPGRIVAMGPTAKTLLSDVFGYAPAEIAAGYSVRQSAIYGRPARREAPAAVHRILVLLQGVAESVELIDLLADAFAEGSEYSVTLRPHPAVPLAGQLVRTKLATLRPPFRVSGEADLHADILQHDIAVFTGSTAGWEAVALGVPAIHVDMGHVAAASPMFAEPALSRTARDAAGLKAAIDALARLTPSEFAAEAARARRFFEGCCAPKTGDAFAAVLAIVACGGKN
jgi:hypothetical protein